MLRCRREEEHCWSNVFKKDGEKILRTDGQMEGLIVIGSRRDCLCRTGRRGRVYGHGCRQ